MLLLNIDSWTARLQSHEQQVLATDQSKAKVGTTQHTDQSILALQAGTSMHHTQGCLINLSRSVNKV